LSPSARGQKETSGKTEIQHLVSPSRHAAAYRPVLVNHCLEKSIVMTLGHFPYSPDLVTANFYLSLGLKSALKVWCFCDATGIKNATEQLKMVP
jgi:hypothetical protein